MSTTELPELLDAAKIRRELGISRAAAEAIMRRLPKVEIPGLRKIYVTRQDLLAEIERNTRR